MASYIRKNVRISARYSLINLGLGLIVSVSLLETSLAQSVFEEIVVTAQKREQNLQDVPISVTALSGDAMEKLGFQSPGDAATQIPNVQFNDEGTVPQFNIRGVQVNDFGDGNEAPVGYYVDEVYFGTLAGQTVGLFDLERVEVLRGPQGTLFGRNTTGGLVHFVTRKPSEEFEAYVSAQLGSFSQRIVEAAVGGAISEKVRARLSAKYNKDDGWQDGSQNGNEFAVTDTIAFRASLDVDLSDTVHLSANVHYSDQNNTSQVYGLAGLLDPVTFAPCSVSEILSAVCVTGIGEPSNLDARVANTEQGTLQNDAEIVGGYIRFDWDLGNNLELVSISAVETVEKFYQEDSDASPNPSNNNLNIATGGAVPLDLPAFLANYTLDSSQFTQEIRLSGNTEGANWVVGAYYYTDDKDTLRFENPLVVAALGSPVGIDNDATLGTDSWAVFAQTDYSLTDAVRLTAGIRYTEDEKDLLIADSFQNPSFLDNEALATESVTWKVGLSWMPTDETHVFANVSKGFKSGTFRTTFSPPGGAPPVAEEEILSYEIGFKSSFSGWGRLSGSAFYNDYTDIQANSVTTVNGVPGSFLINVGDADITGLELEAILTPTDQLEIVLGVGLLDTEIESADPAFNGNELAFSPGLNANGVFRYTFPGVMGGYVSVQASVSHSDSYFLIPDNLPGLEEDGYTLVGARVGWYSQDDKYSIEVFGENLGDEEYFNGGFSVGDFGFHAYIWGKPRRGGVRFGVNF